MPEANVWGFAAAGGLQVWKSPLQKSLPGSQLLWQVPHKSSSEDVEKFIYFETLLLSALPVRSLEHSLKVWEVWVNFSCQPADTSLCLPAVQGVALVARLQWAGVSSYLPAAQSRTPFTAEAQASWNKQKSKWAWVFYSVAQGLRLKGRAESCRFQLLHPWSACSFYSKQTMDNNVE